MYMNDGNKTKINLRNKSVFITGVAGFIGSNLAKRLLSTVEDVKVVGLDNMNHYYDVHLKEARLNELEQFENFSFVKGNLADKSVIEAIFEQYKPEIVVNLGAQAGVRYSITNPDAYVEANLIGFYNILEACRHSYDEGHTPVEHLVYASSSSVYGSNKKVPYSTDDKVDNPVSLYAATKKSNELMAHAYSKLYNIPSTGLRFFTVYGPVGRPDMAYCCVVYYNQNWDRNLSTVFWEDFELKNTFGEYGPDILVPVVGENLGVTCGNILGRSYELLSELQPEGYLVLGDTNSCLSAVSAKRLHIPLFHMEAGNRCKDECLPEETNRRIVDVISDVNMCYSEFARKYLADTGLPKERTYQTGSPMAEVLHMNLEKIQKSDVLERLGLEKDKYILLSAHREENIDSEKNFLSLFTAINALAEKYDMPILYSCHPRSKHRLEKSGFLLDPRVRVNEPLGFNDYNKLQMNALAIVSDSGTLPEESSFYLSIGHPIAAVCIRTSTERPEALEAGDFILAGITTRELLNATDMAIEMKQKGVLGKPCPDYVDETVSMKVVRIIQGYVNVVNKMVWRKY